VNAALELRNDIDRDLYVAYSGGCDSEIVCLSFIEAGTRFKPVIFRFNYGLNDHDIQWAFDFCKVHNLHPIIVEVDIMDFFVSKNRDWSNSYSIASSNVLMSWLYSEFYRLHPEGYLIGGDGYNRFYPSRSISDRMGYFIEVGHLPIFMYLTKSGFLGCPDFFMYTPELIAAFLADDELLRWVNWGTYHGYSSLDWHKNLILCKSWPELKPRRKQTGTENLQPINLSQRRELLLKNLSSFQELEWKHEDLLDYLVGNQNELRPIGRYIEVTDWDFNDR